MYLSRLSSVEIRFYQDVISNLDFDWFPELFYSVTPGNPPTYEVSLELMEASEKFIGEANTPMLRNRLQLAIDDIFGRRQNKREIMVWTDINSRPLFIERATISDVGNGIFGIVPYLDRSVIIDEVISSLEKDNG